MPTKFNKNPLRFLSEKISYTLNMEIDDMLVIKNTMDIYIVLKKDEIQEKLIEER